MNDHPNYSGWFEWPKPDPEIQDALSQAFATGDWGRYDGRNCRRLSEEIAEYFGHPFVRLCASGTVAVEIALKAAGVSAGDEVILSAYDFPGNFRCIEAVGATPVLADAHPESWSILPDSMKLLFGKKTKAIIVSHLHGGTAPIEAITRFAAENGVKVIEDICQCPGASLKSQKLGSFGDIATLSFGGSKLLTAGRGGAVIMKSELDFQRAKIYCDRGNDAFPLSELQACVLLPQLRKLDAQNSHRLDAARRLIQMLSGNDCVSTLQMDADSQPAFYKFPILLKPNSTAHGELETDLTDPGHRHAKQTVIDSLRKKGIVIDHGFSGFAIRSSKRCRKAGDLSGAIQAARSTLILHHPCLLSDGLETIAREINAVTQLS